MALALAALGAVGVASADEPPPVGGCVDESVKADLTAKRRQRIVKDRLFGKAGRHELSASGGYYVADLFEGTYVLGGSYAYHMTEDFGIEASGAYTKFASRGGPELERTFQVLGGREIRALLFDAQLVWSPLHAKMRAGDSIVHFDLSLSAGPGIVDSELTSGLAGAVGLGLKIFSGRALAFRIDIRDHIYRQQLLSRAVLVNDVSATLGVSLFLPIRE